MRMHISLNKVAKLTDYTCSIISGSLSAPLSRRDAKESTILGNNLAKPTSTVNMKDISRNDALKEAIKLSRKKFDKCDKRKPQKSKHLVNMLSNLRNKFIYEISR